MSAKDNGGPAFPWREEDGQGGYDQHVGMSLRDWFAGQALSACVNWVRHRGRDELLEDDSPDHAQPCMPDRDGCGADDVVNAAQAAYLFADAMLAARKEAQP